MSAAAVLLASLSLTEAFEAANRRDPNLLAARAHLPVVEAGVTTAGAQLNPTLSASYGRDEPTFIAGVGMRFPVFGQRGAAVRTARAEVVVSEAVLAEQTVAEHAAVRRAYFTLAIAQAHVTLAEESTKLARALADVARARMEEGAAPPLDSSQADLAWHRAEQEQCAQEAARDAARPALNYLLGDAAEAPSTASDPLMPSIETRTLDHWVSLLEKHPAVIGAEAERLAALARAAQERTVNRPAPDVTIELSNLPGGLGVRGTVAAEVPLLSRNEGPIRAAEATAVEATEREKATRAKLAAGLRAAWTRLTAAVSRARFFAETQVPAAVQVEELARVSYREGRAPLVAVLQAQGDAMSSRLQAVDAVGDAQNALADVEEAAGVGF